MAAPIGRGVVEAGQAVQQASRAAPRPARPLAPIQQIARSVQQVRVQTARAARTLNTQPKIAADPAQVAYRNYLAQRQTKAPAAPRRSISGADLSRIALLAQGGGGGGLGGFLGNLGGDVVSTITGIPSAAQLGAENVGAAALAPLAGLSKAGVPHLGFAQSYLGRVAGLDKKAAQAVAQDYKYRWGPAFDHQSLIDLIQNRGNARANARKFLSRIDEHPGYFAGDVATAYSLAGAGIAGGARALGRATGSEDLLRYGSKAIGPGTARYRPPRQVSVEMGENTAKGLKGRSLQTVEVPRRPYSSNPLTRGVQQQAERIGAKIAASTESADSIIGRQFSSKATHARATSTLARDYRLQADLNRARDLRHGSRDYVQAVRKLDKAGSPLPGSTKSRWTREQVDAALFLHGRDLLRAPGLTPLQARDHVVAFMREGLDKAVQTKGLKSAGAQKTIAAIAAVPDELLDLKHGPPELRQAVQEYRALSGRATQMRLDAGTISPETAKAVQQRSAQAVFEGARYDAKTGQWTSPHNPYTTVGSEGVYTQDIPVDRLKAGKQPGDATGAFGRMTQDKIKQSHGTLFQMGNVSLDRGLPVKALERALVDRDHPQFVKDFYETFAFRRPNGALSKGKRAVTAMEADPENVVLLSGKSLQDAMRKVRDLPEGQLPENPLRAVDSFEGDEGLARAKTLSEVQRNDLVAFPKAAVEGMRTGWEAMAGPKIKVLDTPQTLWKMGILAFAPRWYLNSLVGNTAQWLILTGGDVRSLLQARRYKGIGDILPERLSGSTNVAEARITNMAGPQRAVTRHFVSAAERGMDFQNRMDGLMKRAAYLNRMKKHMRAEGGKFRKLSPDELAQAIADAPEHIKDQSLREAELWLGDFVRLRPNERAVLRRIFPFYAWMKVIGKLMLNMPVRYPKRTAILSLMSRASTDVVNPLDSQQRILANRGRLHFGNFAMRTAGLNPFFTHADLIRNVAGQDVKGALGTLSDNLSPIGLQQAVRTLTGTTFGGTPISFPPGYGGTASSFGHDPQRLDRVLGIPDYYTPTVPLSEQLFQTIPLVPQLVRGIASGGKRPYDTTTTLDLLTRSKPDSQLFQPDKQRGMNPIPYAGPLLSWAGTNVQRYDQKAEEDAIHKAWSDYQDAVRQTAKRVRKLR